MLKQVRGIRCIVFVETTPSQNKTFLGLAEPSKVRELLGQKYPWFEDALRESWANVGSPVLPDNMPLDQAKEVMEGFIFCTLMRTQQESLDDPEWSRLKGDQWDHSRWLDSLQLKQDLTAACYAFSDSTVTRARRDSDAAFLAALLKCPAPFVASLNQRREFQNLYDQQAIRARVAEYITRS